MKKKVNDDSINTDDFSGSYSESKFWDKISKLPRKAGCSVLRSALTLYFLLTEPDVPVWAKAAAVCALGYFVAPIDLIPDFLFGGFTDDITVMAALLNQLQIFINDNINDRVNNHLPAHCRGRSKF